MQNQAITYQINKRYLTFIAGRIPDSVAVDVSDFDTKLVNNSLISAPVFFVFGEPTASDVRSLKEDVVPILSA